MKTVHERAEAILAAAKVGKERDRMLAIRYLCRSASSFLAAVKKFDAHPDVMRHARRHQSRLALAKKAKTALVTIAALYAAAKALAEMLFLQSCGRRFFEQLDGALAELRAIARELREKFFGAQLDLFGEVAR